jgi:hypothetical protein
MHVRFADLVDLFLLGMIAGALLTQIAWLITRRVSK